MPKTSSIRPKVSIELRLVTDRRTDTGPLAYSVARVKILNTCNAINRFLAQFSLEFWRIDTIII